MKDNAVLIVDDERDIRELVMELLEDAQVPCRGVGSGAEAVALVRAAPEAIDVIVLDVNMPGMDGNAVLHELQSAAETAHIPVIMVTAKATSDADVVRGVSGGAIDYLPKPCSPAVLLAKVRAARARALADRELRAALACASRHAQEDPLTGLFNRRHFHARIAQSAAHARRHDEPFAMIMLDLDHFKRINDAHGHEEGDRVLMAFAAHIRGVLRADDVPFRYGGEEFVLLLHACDASRAMEVAARLRGRLTSRPHRFADGSEQRITFSAGVASALSAEEFAGEPLVDRADRALYAAKAAGRDQVRSWHEGIDDLLQASPGPSHATSAQRSSDSR